MEPIKIRQPMIKIPKLEISDVISVQHNENPSDESLSTNPEKSIEPATSGVTVHGYADLIESMTNYKQILCTQYFEIVSRDGDRITVVCKTCVSVVRDYISKFSNLLRHLRVSRKKCMFFICQMNVWEM